MASLNKKIDLKHVDLKLGKQGKMPTKRTINLAQVGVEKIDPIKAVPAIILIVILAAVFSKFAVYDRLNALSKAQSEVSELQSQLDSDYEQIQEYGDMSDSYAHYTYSGMTDDELSLVNRDDLVKLLAKDVMGSAKIQSWTLTGNQVEVTFTDYSLKLINKIVQKLQNEDLVDYCSVSTAQTNDPEESTTTKVITDSEGNRIVQTTPNSSTYDDVSATIIIYLKSATEQATTEEGGQ